MTKFARFLAAYRFHLLLIAIGLFSLAVFNSISQIGIQPIIYYDSASYKTSASDLYIFHRGHAYRPLLMALISGIPYIFGLQDTAVYTFSFYVNVVCWLCSALMLFEILRNYIKTNVAFLFATASLLLVGNMALVFHLLTENIYLFFISSAFYLMSRYLKTGHFLFVAAASSIFVLSMLIKPGAKFLAIIFLLINIRPVAKNLKSKSAYLIYGSFLLVMIQCGGLKYQFGNFTVSYIDAVTYYDYLGAKAESLESAEPFQDIWTKRAHHIYGLGAARQKQEAFTDFENQLSDNFANLAKAYAMNVFENASTPSLCISDCRNIKRENTFPVYKKVLLAVSKWQNVVLSAIGILLAVYFIFKKYKDDKLHAMLSIFILYTILLSGISCSEGDRFNVIAFPAVLVLLAKFLSDNSAEYKA